MSVNAAWGPDHEVVVGSGHDLVVQQKPKEPTKTPKTKPVIAKNSGTLRIQDLAVFFGVSWHQMNKELLAADVQIKNMPAVLNFIAKRLIEPLLKS